MSYSPSIRVGPIAMLMLKMSRVRVCFALAGVLVLHVRMSVAFVMHTPLRAAAASSGEAAAASVESVETKDLPQALIFDCDGVLADTERDGHRPAFNAAFKIKNLGEGFIMFDCDFFNCSLGNETRTCKSETQR